MALGLGTTAFLLAAIGALMLRFVASRAVLDGSAVLFAAGFSVSASAIGFALHRAARHWADRAARRIFELE